MRRQHSHSKSNALAALVLMTMFGSCGALAGDRLMVDFNKTPTGSASGLEYEYEFTVMEHGSGDAVEGAEFMISTDMPSMPGAHHMPHVKGEAGDIPGSYKAKMNFDMPGEWNLILRFTQPQRDQVVLSDNVEVQADGKGHGKMDHAHKEMDHSKHEEKKEE
ncbi:MAG: FixH family protein [Gammaproteobacteria bacterium]